MISKRSLFRMTAGATALSVLPRSVLSAPAAVPSIGMRGSIDAGAQGFVPDVRGNKGRPGPGDETSRKLNELIAKAARQNLPVFLPPGQYHVSGLMLPDGTRLTGIAGATRLIHNGGGFMLRARDARRIELSDLVIDGDGQPLGDAPSLIDFAGVEEAVIDGCAVIASIKTGVRLERCGGRIHQSSISSAAEYGLYAVDSSGLAVSNNRVSDCGNGGILIHRWSKGFDGTIVSGNRVQRIGAANGGTGQFGNAINLFRAEGVAVTGNQIAHAAFSAIRANSASNIQIANNQCFASGETAIYSEFAFEGAIVSGNLVDGAANGISVVNFNEGGRMATVANNIVRNLSTTGPYVLEEAIFGVGISVEADTTVTGNVVENAPLWGLALGFGNYLRNVVATGNVVRESGIGCAVTVVEGAGGAVISGNMFQGMRRGAIIGHRWKEVATADLATGGEASRFPQLTIDGNRVI